MSQLPSPIRAAVGLIASVADEAPSFPDKAIELPMLAVSTALQLSLRAQQRYAQLVARGDEVLDHAEPTDEPPAWASFDPPVGDEEPTTGNAEPGLEAPGNDAAGNDGPGIHRADEGGFDADAFGTDVFGTDMVGTAGSDFDSGSVLDDPTDIASPPDIDVVIDTVVDGDAAPHKRIPPPRRGTPSAFDAIGDE